MCTQNITTGMWLHSACTCYQACASKTARVCSSSSSSAQGASLVAQIMGHLPTVCPGVGGMVDIMCMAMPEHQVRLLQQRTFNTRCSKVHNWAAAR